MNPRIRCLDGNQGGIMKRRSGIKCQILFILVAPISEIPGNDCSVSNGQIPVRIVSIDRDIPADADILAVDIAQDVVRYAEIAVPVRAGDDGRVARRIIEPECAVPLLVQIRHHAAGHYGQKSSVQKRGILKDAAVPDRYGVILVGTDGNAV